MYIQIYISSLLNTADVSIGVSKGKCYAYFKANKSNDCCQTDTGQSMVLGSTTDFFFVYGTVNVSVQQEWLSPTEHHYHTDLGLYIDKINPLDPYFKVY